MKSSHKANAMKLVHTLWKASNSYLEQRKAINASKIPLLGITTKEKTICTPKNIQNCA